jgi:hypothetical protein
MSCLLRGVYRAASEECAYPSILAGRRGYVQSRHAGVEK